MAKRVYKNGGQLWIWDPLDATPEQVIDYATVKYTDTNIEIYDLVEVNLERSVLTAQKVLDVPFADITDAGDVGQGGTKLALMQYIATEMGK